MRNKFWAILLIPLAILIFSGCNKKSEELKIQTDNFIEEVKSTAEEQQAKIEELQKYKDEQLNLLEQEKQQENINNCQEAKKYCGDRLSTLVKEKEYRDNSISGLKDEIKESKKSKKIAEENN